MRILVIGASRGIGRETVATLNSFGHEPVALSRSPYPPRHRDTALGNWHRGDARDKAILSRALAGAEAVIVTLGIANRDLIATTNLFSDTTRVLLLEMKERGVKRLIAVTGFGAGRSRSAISPLQRLPFDFFFGRAYADKDLQEQMIVGSDLDWTIVRPGVLTNGPRTSRYRILADPRQWRNGLISRRNVAEFLVKQATDTEYIGRDLVLVC